MTIIGTREDNMIATKAPKPISAAQVKRDRLAGDMRALVETSAAQPFLIAALVANRELRMLVLTQMLKQRTAAPAEDPARAWAIRLLGGDLDARSLAKVAVQAIGKDGAE